MARTLKSPNDRTLNRLIVGAILVLVIGIPLVGFIYFLDRYVDAGPSMVDRSIAAGEEAVRQNPNQVGARLQLAESYVAAGRFQDAVTQYAEVLRAQPDNRLALVGRGQAYLSIGNLDAAVTDFSQLVAIAKDAEMANVDPQLQAAYYQLGSIALQRGQPKDAIDQLEKALRINRTDADSLNLYATALLQTGDPATAVEALKRAVALVPSGWCEPYAQLAQAYTALGDSDGVRYASGMVAQCEKRPAEAEAALATLTSGPFAIDALIGLAFVAEDLGDTTAAASYYSQVIAKDSANFIAITGLNRLAVDPAAAGSTPAPSPSPSAGASN